MKAFTTNNGNIIFNNGTEMCYLVDKKIIAEDKITHKVINRTNGLIEHEGNYSSCKKYFLNQGFDMSIFKIDEPTHDEEGNSNAIESN